MRAAHVRRVLDQGAEAIFVAVQTGCESELSVGYRTLRVVVMEETLNGHKVYQRRVCEELRIACSLEGVQLVRRALLEMGEKLDGAVVVT